MKTAKKNQMPLPTSRTNKSSMTMVILTHPFNQELKQWLNRLGISLNIPEIVSDLPVLSINFLNPFNQILCAVHQERILYKLPPPADWIAHHGHLSFKEPGK
jgi:hypothetical protein